MKKILFLLFCSPIFVFAQDFDLRQIDNFKSNKIIRFNDQKINTEDFFLEYSKQLGLSNDSRMDLKYMNIDQRGASHAKYEQFYKGLRVIGGSYFLHSKNNEVFRSTGNIFPNINVDIEENLNEDIYKNIAKNYLFKEFEKEERIVDYHNLDIINSELNIMDFSYPNFSGNYRLVRNIVLGKSDVMPPIKRRVIIDVKTRKVLLSYSEIHDESVPALGQSLYYGEVGFITDSVASDLFYLHDDTRGNGIIVNNNWDQTGNYSDSDNYWEFDDKGNRSAIDAMYCSAAYYDLLKNEFNRNSIDGEGFPLIANVNVKSLVNAFWNGESTTYGSGNCFGYNPLTTMSIIGHEFTHGLTSFTSQLIYYKESGALNESISDIFGEYLEYKEDNSNFDWIVGSRFLVGGSKAFRSMKDPKEYDKPAFYKGENWWTNWWDSYGVHTNSSVLNYWFYLISEGKSGGNENGEFYNVNGIGIEKAIQIVYDTEVNYLTESSGYNDMYVYTVEVTKDLYGEGSPELLSIQEAWKAVGLPNYTIPEFEEEDIYLELEFNRKKSVFGTSVCQEAYDDMELAITNSHGRSYEKGVRLNMEMVQKVSFSSIYLDTFRLDTILEDGFELGDVFYYKFGLDTTMVDDFFGTDYNFRFSIELVEDTITYKNENGRSIRFTDVVEDYWAKIDIKNVIECDTESSVDYFKIEIYNRGCRVFVESDSIIIKFVSDEHTYYLKYRAIDWMPNGSISLYKIARDFNFNKLENIGDYRFEVEIVTDGERKEVFAQDFSLYLNSHLIEDEIIDFSDDSYESILAIDKGNGVDMEIKNERLLFSDDYPSSQFETCLPLEDYYRTIGRSNKSKVKFCVAIDHMESPILAFDLKMVNSFTSFENNLYAHLFRAYQGNVAITEIINSTDGKFKRFEIPLDKSLSNYVNLDIITFGPRVYIDNIEIFDKKFDGVINARNIEGYKISNPVSHEIKIIPANLEPHWSMELYSVKGELLFKQKNINGELVIDVSNYQAGVCFYKIVNDKNEIVSGKVIVTK